MKIALVVLNYNSSEECRKCVRDLKAQTNIEIEIIVVDNCSREDDRSAVQKLCEENSCIFLTSMENRGYNAGNNIGLRYAAEKGYEFAAICNPDMEFPQKNYFSHLISFFQQDESIVICAGAIQTPAGVPQNPKACPKQKWYQSFRWVKNIFLRKNAGTVPNWIDSPSEPHFCEAVNGCCFLVRMSFLNMIGFFDERTFLYGEEAILGRQVVMSGKRIYYSPANFAIHNHKKSKEGTPHFCSKHWCHSQLIYTRYYSGYPFYGKWFSEFSIVCYFFALNLYHRIKYGK